MFHPAAGTAAPVESVTLSIYKEERGGTALWTETQNVSVDAEGRYTVLMGSTLPEGVPADLFTTGEPRWLGVQFNRPGEAEQPRTQLVSVPYALRAVDAETLGGKPASSYLLAPSVAEETVGDAGTSPAKLTNSGPSATPAVKSAKPQVASGMTNCIAEFMNTTDIGCSNIWQSGINIGINTMNPTVAFDLGAGSFRVANYSAPSSGVGLELAYIPINNSGYIFAYDRGALVAKDLNIGGSGAAITVKASGLVGVGVSNPASNLDVAGDINFSGGLRIGGVPLLSSSQSQGNLSLGVGALPNITSRSMSTAVGQNALEANSGAFNSAFGYNSLASNTTGGTNSAFGPNALYSNRTADGNSGFGVVALYANTTGNFNSAFGAGALEGNVTGSYNSAFGYSALGTLIPNAAGSYNSAFGFGTLSNVTGNYNVAVGYQAGNNVTSGSNNIEIGNQGSSTDNNTIRIGTSGTQTSFVAAGIRAVTTGNNDAVPVLIDSNGQLGTVSSSRRFKEDIADMGTASSGLMRLHPVTFRYKKPFEDGSKPMQYGLIAEEVAEVYPDLVARGTDGEIETVKYQLLPTMLLNELQRQERTIQEQQRSMEGQAREIETLKAKLSALSSLEARLAALESATNGNR